MQHIWQWRLHFIWSLFYSTSYLNSYNIIVYGHIWNMKLVFTCINKVRKNDSNILWSVCWFVGLFVCFLLFKCSFIAIQWSPKTVVLLGCFRSLKSLDTRILMYSVVLMVVSYSQSICYYQRVQNWKFIVIREN